LLNLISFLSAQLSSLSWMDVGEEEVAVGQPGTWRLCHRSAAPGFQLSSPSRRKKAATPKAQQQPAAFWGQGCGGTRLTSAFSTSRSRDERLTGIVTD